MKNHNFYLTSLIIFLTLNSCASQKGKNLTCKDFRTGTFEFSSELHHTKFVLERTREIQIEQSLDLTTNKRIRPDTYFYIKWIDDCQYFLTIDTTRPNYDEYYLKYNPSGGIKSKILSIDNNCALTYTFAMDQSIKSTICKIK